MYSCCSRILTLVIVTVEVYEDLVENPNISDSPESEFLLHQILRLLVLLIYAAARTLPSPPSPPRSLFLYSAVMFMTKGSAGKPFSLNSVATGQSA